MKKPFQRWYWVKEVYVKGDVSYNIGIPRYHTIKTIFREQHLGRPPYKYVFKKRRIAEECREFLDNPLKVEK